MNITEYGYIPDGKPSQDGETPARVTAVYKDRYEIICSYGTGLAALKKEQLLYRGRILPHNRRLCPDQLGTGGGQPDYKNIDKKNLFCPPGSLFGRPLGAAGSREL